MTFGVGVASVWVKVDAVGEDTVGEDDMALEVSAVRQATRMYPKSKKDKRYIGGGLTTLYHASECSLNLTRYR